MSARGKNCNFCPPRYSIVHCHIHLQGVTQWPAKPPPKLSKIKSRTKAFSELSALIEESDKLLKSSASLVGEEGETLREQVAIKLKQALESVSNVRERSKPVVDATETYIGGHPWQTVAISAGFGLVVGLLLGRRN